MKPRRVLLTLEVETSVPLPRLRIASDYAVSLILDNWEEWWDDFKVLQAQANVIKASGKAKARK